MKFWKLEREQKMVITLKWEWMMVQEEEINKLGTVLVEIIREENKLWWKVV